MFESIFFVFIRRLLFPFSVVYGVVTWFRNYLFDIGFFTAYTFDLPIIAVGNLSVGGTGKTPQIEYLVDLLSNDFQVAILSRGYKRKSKGFVLADAFSDAESIGDEPFQYYKKFKNIVVAVDSDRKNGIKKLLALPKKPDIILLDDAFQHRRVCAGFYVLLTAFDDLYCNDFMLPTGNLRESRTGAKRANVIVVTKCPADLSHELRVRLIKKLNILPHQKIFFTTVAYEDVVRNESDILSVSHIKKTSKTIVAGIAKPKPFVDFIKNDKDQILLFSDHHHFSDDEILNIKQKSTDKIIVTTEKDFVRLQNRAMQDNLYYLSIKTKFIENGENFDKMIREFVVKFSFKQ